MGCEQSTPVNHATPTPKKTIPPEPSIAPSEAEAIAERTTSSPLATELILGDRSCPVRLQYAYCSRTGLDQRTCTKYTITKKFAGDSKEAVLGVYEGIDDAQQLPKYLAKHVTQKRMHQYRTSGAPPPHYLPSQWATLSQDEYEQCCRAAYREGQRGMLPLEASAITVHLYGEHITVCNVGECRAILGHVVDDSNEAEETKEEIGAAEHRDDPLLAIPLAIKPDASSSSSPQALPLDPVILTSRLCLNDKILVIGSSSVFKYLSNKAILRFCASADNAVVAAQEIVEAAHDQYLFHEQRTDDITVIVCFLECDRNAGPDTTEELVECAKQSGGTATTLDSSGGSSGGSLSTATPNASSDLQNAWDDSYDVPDVILRL